MTIDERIAAELRRQAPQVDQHMAWVRIQSAAAMGRRSRALRLVTISVAALGLVLVGPILVSTLSSDPATSPSQSPFLATWVSTDDDGSTLTMVIQGLGGESVQILVHDDSASVCSGSPSTMTGTGRLSGRAELVIPSPVLTCDDGSRPEALSGPPLEEQLQNLSFVHDPRTDTLTDNLGSVWGRVGGGGPSPEATTPTVIWPQSNLEEVREAQRLADAGDPRYTWQVDPELEEDLSWGRIRHAEIFVRFIQEELGWEGFSLMGYASSDWGPGTIGVRYVRCAPGESNSNYPDDDQGSGCLPTIGEFHYETAEIFVAQPARQGPSGIWVVASWVTVEPIEQVVPLTDSEAAAILEAFLQARIDGERAEQYFFRGDGGAPLLYATTTGATYERSEFELVDGPAWPSGWMRFEVRLFAEDGHTVVEQSFSLERDRGGRWGLKAGFDTFENGKARPEFHYILGGEVTFEAGHPWFGLFGPSFEIDGEWADTSLSHPEGHFLRLVAGPLPLEAGCQEDLAPANAAALVQSILDDDDFETTAPLAATVGGVPALQMDVVASATTAPELGCDEWLRSAVLRSVVEPGGRMRLYLVDLPGGSARILSIVIVASEERLESAVQAAAAILDSFEFHTG